MACIGADGVMAKVSCYPFQFNPFLVAAAVLLLTGLMLMSCVYEYNSCTEKRWKIGLAMLNETLVLPFVFRFLDIFSRKSKVYFF